MRLTVLSLVAVLLLPCAVARAGKPKTVRPKDGDYVKIEARGTVQKSSRAVSTRPDVFVCPPNPCAAGFLFEEEMKRYKFQLGSARIQPRLVWQPQPEEKSTYSIRVRDGGEWELDIDDRFAELF